MKENAKSFKDLIVWQKAHQWVLDIYQLTKSFPKEELFGLTSQLRRAAVSITANIAEGFKRRGYNDKAKFYNIAQSSLEECRYYLILATDLKFINCIQIMNNLEEISRILEKYYLSVIELGNKKLSCDRKY
jgi:four helix bundle protein